MIFLACSIVIELTVRFAYYFLGVCKHVFRSFIVYAIIKANEEDYLESSLNNTVVLHGNKQTGKMHRSSYPV